LELKSLIEPPSTGPVNAGKIGIVVEGIAIKWQLASITPIIGEALFTGVLIESVYIDGLDVRHRALEGANFDARTVEPSRDDLFGTHSCS
jgi:hypothetical protein